jgi:hypothetical protein
MRGTDRLEPLPHGSTVRDRDAPDPAGAVVAEGIAAGVEGRGGSRCPGMQRSAARISASQEATRTARRILRIGRQTLSCACVGAEHARGDARRLVRRRTDHETDR